MTRVTTPRRPVAAVIAVVVALTAAGLLLGLTVTAGTAAAIDTGRGRPGPCPDANGVTVVIDFQQLGGGAIMRCAMGDQPTGHAAIKNAGFQITGVQRWGEAFVCRIEGKPGPDTERCINTPPVSAFWSYWYASNGGSWTFSQQSLMSRKPPLGSFEGWSFSQGRTQSTSPPPRAAPVRPVAPLPPSPPRPGPAQPITGGDGGLPASTVAGLLLVLGLGVIAGLIVVRRRRSAGS
jgi:hypothetical protein